MAKLNALDHPKNTRLALQLRLPALFTHGVLSGLWTWCRIHSDDGSITKLDIMEIVGRYGAITFIDPDQLIAAMTNVDMDCVLLDELSPDHYYLHNYHEHVETYIHRRLARDVRCFANGMMPSLTSFNKDNRPEILALYVEKYGPGIELVRPKAPKTPICAPKNEKRAPKTPIWEQDNTIQDNTGQDSFFDSGRTKKLETLIDYHWLSELNVIETIIAETLFGLPAVTPNAVELWPEIEDVKARANEILNLFGDDIKQISEFMNFFVAKMQADRDITRRTKPWHSTLATYIHTELKNRTTQKSGTKSILDDMREKQRLFMEKSNG